MKKMLVVMFCIIGALAFSGNAMALTVSSSSNASALAGLIGGTGITIFNETYSGSADSSGAYAGGAVSGLGTDAGLILTTGSVYNAPGPNDSPSITGIASGAGDADLNAIVGGGTTDSSILEFDFTSANSNLYFNYAFASEEYNEWVFTAYNDVFAFFLDGVNIALVPSTIIPVDIDTVNLSANSAYYNNNDPALYNIQYDGFTDVFTAQALGLSAGTHHIKLAISDRGDQAYDSAVFIQGGSFSDEETPPDDNPVPEPSTILLLGGGLAGLYFMRKKQ